MSNDGRLIFNSSGNLTINSTISGNGSVTLTGSGTVTFINPDIYSGTTTISNGTLLVNNTSGHGAGSGAVTVANGGHLGGSGTIAGAVIINSGGTLSPGNPVGTLTINNVLIANSGAIFNFSLGNTSDKVVVNNSLTLAGTLNITNGAGFTTTTYTLFSYSGTLTLGNLTLNLPASTLASINTNTPGQVNLVVRDAEFEHPGIPGCVGIWPIRHGRALWRHRLSHQQHQ